MIKRETLNKYYKWSCLFALAAIAINAVMGYTTAGIVGLFSGILAIVILGVLEVSLSFDNAVLNAKKLKDMDQYWREWFIKWGILIAVFGMRLVFPVAIVSILGQFAPWEAVALAINDPKQYSQILSDSHHLLMGFGGVFLMMVAMEFFLDHEKDFHWISPLERPLAAIGRFGLVADGVLVSVIMVIVSFFIEKSEQVGFLIAGALGLAMFVGIHFLKGYLEDEDEEDSTAATAVGAAAKSGLAGVIYLEVLDASMSFDGVIGAFAITTNIFTVMLGLGVGAFFVRSMTIHMVDSGTLSEYRYLEHGALWAIFALATIMILSPVMHVSEVFTGLIGATLVGIAVWHSVKANRKERGQVTT